MKKSLIMHSKAMNPLILILVAVLLVSVFGVSYSTGAEGLMTGRDIALKMDAVDTSDDGSMRSVMVIERKGQKLIRVMESFKKKYGDDERQLIRFLEPPDVRDTMYLTWNYAQLDSDDDTWVYLSCENMVRRISGGGKKSSFMRSDLAVEDTSIKEVDDDNHLLLGSETLYGIGCYKVEMRAKKQKDTGYSKRIVWVRKDIWLPVKIEYYNKRDKLFKTAIYGGFEEIDGIWKATKGVVETPGRRSRTTIVYKDIRHNTGLGDGMFNQSNLKR